MSRTLLGSVIRLAYAKSAFRSDLLPMIRAAAASQKLNTRVRQKINGELRRRGMDGNGRFRSIGQALGVISEVIGTFGLEPDDVFSANRFRSESGHTNFYLAFSNPEDPFSPVPMSNSMLAIQWTTLDSGKYEVVAYLS